MKFLTGLIFVFLIIVYGYAYYMTSVEPEKQIWGYICAVVFVINFMLAVSIFTKNQKNNNSNSL